MEFKELREFNKDLKKLLKKHRTLNEDLKVVKKVLAIRPQAGPPFSFRIDQLGIETCIIKVKKIACKALKGKGVYSGFRLVYAFFPEKEEIIFIELYHKSDKACENKERILKNFK